jgi:hypothetical protein
MQRRRVLVILVVALFLPPLLVFAQDYRRGDRGDIQVTNDWQDTVTVTLWKERGGQMSRQTWTIHPGQSALLAGEDGRSLRVRGNDKIKVGDDWGRVDIGAVGQNMGGIWYVNVREVWRATHQRGRGRPGGLPPDQPRTVNPPYTR